MNFLKKIFGKKEEVKEVSANDSEPRRKIKSERIGELGEYKINIQLDQFPSNYKHLGDLMLINEKSRTGFSQIDHILLTPYGLFVIETKNYTGEIVGGKSDKQWNVSGKYKMLNPFHQNFGHIQTIKKHLQLSDNNSIFSVISFTRRAIFRIDPELRKIQSNELCIYDTELTEFIKRKIQVTKLQNSSSVYSDKEIETMFNTLKAANISDENMREAHKLAIKSPNSNQDSICTVCGKNVSKNVREFCLSKEKFNGKIYCFEHQKKIIAIKY